MSQKDIPFLFEENTVETGALNKLSHGPVCPLKIHHVRGEMASTVKRRWERFEGVPTYVQWFGTTTASSFPGHGGMVVMSVARGSGPTFLN